MNKTVVVYDDFCDLYVGLLGGYFTVEEFDFRSGFDYDCCLEFVRKFIYVKREVTIIKKDNKVVDVSSKYYYRINGILIEKKDLTYEMLKNLPR